MQILVTGGAGYIGSHTCVELLQAGYDVVVADNLCNAKRESLRRVERITGKTLTFYPYDICNARQMNEIFENHAIDGVIHFAGLKAVGESCRIPLDYYANNIGGTVTLCKVMAAHGVKKLVFSSSATVYGNSPIPYREDMPTGSCTNPYGRTKYMIEEILKDLHASDPAWRIALLRYFNPVGAHASGLIGEDPNGIPNNLVPYIAKVAVGKLPCLPVFGNDYPTPDGTGVRDYIHVSDLAEGHVAALAYLQDHEGIDAFNLGSGKGTSVLELVRAFEQACGHPIAYEVRERRPGDLPIYYADPHKAKQAFGFVTKRDVNTMCADTWRWQSANPDGYPED